MLAKKYRLPVQGAYMKPGKNLRTDFLTAKIIKSTLPYSRFGVVIGKKISKSSVRRNWFRRIFFNWVRERSLYKFPNRDVMIILLPKARIFVTKHEFIDVLESINL